MIRQWLGKLRRHWFWTAVGLLAVTLIALSIHSPQRVKVTIRYRGTPEWLPESYTVGQTFRAQRCIPFLTCTWSLMSGTTRDIYGASRRIPATKEGLTFELDRARWFSLGVYEEEMTVLETSRKDGEPRMYGELGTGREVRESDSVTRADYHILDVGHSRFFQLGLGLVRPETRITIDFDPILYTQFADLRGRGAPLSYHTHCNPSAGGLTMSLNVPRTLRYRTRHFPTPRPGQPLPTARGQTEAFFLDTTHLDGLYTERIDDLEWEQLRSRAFHPENVRLVHDREEKTVTLVVTESPRKGDVLDKHYLVAVVGTPSADGRYFGIDCLRLQMETRGDTNPMIRTLFQMLPDEPELSRDRCASDDLPRLELPPNATHVLRYETKITPDPIPSDTIPRPRGPTEIFILDAAYTEKLEGTPLPAEWEELKRKAIHPREVQLIHDRKAKTVTVKLKGALKKDYAVVAGTPSTDGRYFGLACARIRVPKAESRD